MPRKIQSNASFHLTLKYACAKRQYSPQASRDHSKQSGKGTASSPSIGQIRLRYPKPTEQILSNTHRKLWTWALMWTIHGPDSFENSKGENAACCPSLPQALTIKEDVTLGIPQSRPLGWKWLQQVSWRSIQHWKAPCQPKWISRTRNGLLSAFHICTLTTTSCRRSMTLLTLFDHLLANLNSGPVN